MAWFDPIVAIINRWGVSQLKIRSGEFRNVFNALVGKINGNITDEEIAADATIDPKKAAPTTAGVGTYAHLEAQIDALAGGGAFVSQGGDTMTGLLVLDGGIGGPSADDGAYPDFPHCSSSNHKVAMAAGNTPPSVSFVGGEKIRLRGRILEVPVKTLDLSASAVHLWFIRVALDTSGEPSTVAGTFSATAVPHDLATIKTSYGNAAGTTADNPYGYGEVSSGGGGATFVIKTAGFTTLPSSSYDTTFYGAGNEFFSDVVTFLTGPDKGKSWRIRDWNSSTNTFTVDTTVDGNLSAFAGGEVFVIERVGITLNKLYNPTFRTDGIGTGKSSRVSALIAKAYTHNAAGTNPSFVTFSIHANAGMLDRLGGAETFMFLGSITAGGGNVTITHNINRYPRMVSVRALATAPAGAKGLDFHLAAPIVDQTTVGAAQESGIYAYASSPNAVVLVPGANFVFTANDGSSKYGVTASKLAVQLVF